MRKIYNCDHIPHGLDIPDSAHGNVMGSVFKGLAGYMGGGGSDRVVKTHSKDVPTMKMDTEIAGKINFNRALSARFFGEITPMERLITPMQKLAQSDQQFSKQSNKKHHHKHGKHVGLLRQL